MHASMQTSLIPSAFFRPRVSSALLCASWFKSSLTLVLQRPVFSLLRTGSCTSPTLFSFQALAAPDKNLNNLLLEPSCFCPRCLFVHPSLAFPHVWPYPEIAKWKSENECPILADLNLFANRLGKLASGYVSPRHQQTSKYVRPCCSMLT